MQRLSALLFSKDDAERLMNAIGSIYHEADEVVVIDSSNADNLALLRKRIEQKNLKKVRIFNLCALGYPELYHTYGINKCRCDWVLYLSSTESVNEKLREDVRRIIESSDADGLVVSRRELDINKNIIYCYADVRLFKREKASTQGLAGEHLSISGKVGRLPLEYAIIHYTDYDPAVTRTYLGLTTRTYLGSSYKHLQGYLMNERLQHRITYGGLLQKSGSAFVRGVLRLYFFVKNVKLDSELTGTDYRLAFAAYHAYIIYRLIRNGTVNLNYIRYGLAFDELKVRAFLDGSASARKLELDIQNDTMKHGGIIKYMKLDTDHGWRSIDRSSKRLKLSGAALRFELLKEKHLASKR
jgi:hypothetical protein